MKKSIYAKQSGCNKEQFCQKLFDSGEKYGSYGQKCSVGIGTAPRHEKINLFLNCHIVLSFRDRIFLFLAVCTQCCWQPMQIIVIHQKRYGFLQNEILQKLRRRHRDVGIGTFCRGTFCNILTNLNVLIDKSYD